MDQFITLFALTIPTNVMNRYMYVFNNYLKELATCPFLPALYVGIAEIMLFLYNLYNYEIYRTVFLRVYTQFYYFSYLLPE